MPEDAFQPEPWLRGTLAQHDPIHRQIVHALQLTAEDVERWCASLTAEQMNARPAGVAPVAYHLRHIARSLDRLLTYAEGRALSPAQHEALADELAPGAEPSAVLGELHAGLDAAATRILRIGTATFDQPRTVGRQQLPTTVAGLLIHCAEHTQRHMGQAITTSQIVTRP